MNSFNRLYLRTVGGREFVLCAANSTLPLGVDWETPAECLWRLRGAVEYGQVHGVRDFLARESLVPVLGYPSDGDESMRVLEEMIERRMVAGYFPEGNGPGASLGGSLGSGAQPAFSFPEAQSIEALLAYAQSFGGGRSARNLSSSSPSRASQNPPVMIPPTAPGSDFGTRAENAPASVASPPGDLVAVATKFLGTGTRTQASTPDTGAESGTEDGVSPVDDDSAAPGLVEAPALGSSSSDDDAEGVGLVALPASETKTQKHDYVLRVVDEDGKPIAGIEVIFGPSAVDPMKTTDADGWAQTTSSEASLEVSFKLPKSAPS